MSLTSAYSLCASLVLICMTSVASIYQLYTLNASYEGQRKKIHRLSSTVFSYQVKYDGVYETAYPNYMAETDNMAQKSQNSDPVPQIVIANKEETQSKRRPKIPEQKNIKHPSPSLSPTTIENFAHKFEKNFLNVSFSIKNNISPTLSSGYVFGVARFRPQGEEAFYVKSPESILVDDSGVPTAYDHAFKFRIRYFKSKSLRFKYPLNLTSE